SLGYYTMPRLWIVAGVLRPDLWAIALNLGGQGCINDLAHDKVFAKAIILCRGRHHDRRGEHRLVDNCDCPGSVHDFAGAGPVLWRAGPRREPALRADAVLRHSLPRLGSLASLRLEPHLQRPSPLVWRPG